MLVGMGELCDQVLLQSLPTVDWMLDLVLALEGGGIGWVVDPRCSRQHRTGGRNQSLQSWKLSES